MLSRQAAEMRLKVPSTTTLRPRRQRKAAKRRDEDRGDRRGGRTPPKAGTGCRRPRNECNRGNRQAILKCHWRLRASKAPPCEDSQMLLHINKGCRDVHPLIAWAYIRRASLGAHVAIFRDPSEEELHKFESGWKATASD